MARQLNRLQKSGTAITISLIASTVALSLFAPCSAQTLKEVLESDPYRKVAGAAEAAGRVREQSAARKPAVTNYELLWHTRKPGSMLLDWIGAKNTGAAASHVAVGIRQEYAHASVNLSNREGVRVELTIQVPRPEYVTMAEYKTLSSFNRFRPPALDVVADQVVPFQGAEATYYRHQDGACSLFFTVAKQGIVNLYTKRCSDSSVMMKFAKTLNFERLSSKLNS
jgi:hypothetical protein